MLKKSCFKRLGYLLQNNLPDAPENGSIQLFISGIVTYSIQSSRGWVTGAHDWIGVKPSAEIVARYVLGKAMVGLREKDEQVRNDANKDDS